MNKLADKVIYGVPESSISQPNKQGIRFFTPCHPEQHEQREKAKRACLMRTK